MSVSVLIAGGIIGYFLYEPLFGLLRSPLSEPLYYSSPAGSFVFVLKICLLVATAIALPVIIYNLIMFIQPAFKERVSRMRVYMTTLGSVILAAAGATFAFAVILPASMRFFIGFQVTGLHALLDASTYLMFVVNIIISFMIIFQLPLIISFIDHIKPISPKRLLKSEKYIIIGGLVVGLLVPFAFDPVTQILIAVPIIVLYNLSVVLILMQHAYNNRHSRISQRSVAPKTEILSTQFEPAAFEGEPESSHHLPFISSFTDDIQTPPQDSTKSPVLIKGHRWMDIIPSRPIGG